MDMLVILIFARNNCLWSTNNSCFHCESVYFLVNGNPLSTLNRISRIDNNRLMEPKVTSSSCCFYLTNCLKSISCKPIIIFPTQKHSYFYRFFFLPQCSIQQVFTFRLELSKMQCVHNKIVLIDAF